MKENSLLMRLDRRLLEHQWTDFLRIWTVVGASMVVQQNLLVVALSEDLATRQGAAWEVATTIASVLDLALCARRAAR